MAETWQEEADVVIVGYGGAGATAAISAHDAGASVIVLEKDFGRREYSLSHECFSLPDEQPCRLRNICALCRLAPSSTKLSIPFWNGAQKMPNSSRSSEADVERFIPAQLSPKLAGSETMVRYRVKGPAGERGGVSLWNLLSKNVQQRKIPRLPGDRGEKTAAVWRRGGRR